MELRSPDQLHADAERLADIFTVLQRCFMQNLAKELIRGKISFAQYFLLGYLEHCEHLTMSQIAGRMGHTTAAATGLIDRLEKLGYAKRVHASEDRRKILVRITRRGSDLVGRVRGDMVENLMKLMTLLAPDEQAMWLQIYEKIFASFDQQCAGQ